MEASRFKVLFSKRISQRDKKWTDGEATITREGSADGRKYRAIIDDEDGNRISDGVFEQETIEEGNEIKVGGILIQIGSVIGRAPTPEVQKQKPSQAAEALREPKRFQSDKKCQSTLRRSPLTCQKGKPTEVHRSRRTIEEIIRFFT